MDKRDFHLTLLLLIKLLLSFYQMHCIFDANEEQILIGLWKTLVW